MLDIREESEDDRLDAKDADLVDAEDDDWLYAEEDLSQVNTSYRNGFGISSFTHVLLVDDELFVLEDNAAILTPGATCCSVFGLPAASHCPQTTLNSLMA